MPSRLETFREAGERARREEAQALARALVADLKAGEDVAPLVRELGAAGFKEASLPQHQFSLRNQIDTLGKGLGVTAVPAALLRLSTMLSNPVTAGLVLGLAGADAVQFSENLGLVQEMREGNRRRRSLPPGSLFDVRGTLRDLEGK